MRFEFSWAWMGLNWRVIWKAVSIAGDKRGCLSSWEGKEKKVVKVKSIGPHNAQPDGRGKPSPRWSYGKSLGSLWGSGLGYDWWSRAELELPDPKAWIKACGRQRQESHDKGEPLAEAAHYITLIAQNKRLCISARDFSCAVYLKYLGKESITSKGYFSASDLHWLPLAEYCLC